MIVLRSRLLTDHGFRHGFSLRGGGVSEGAFRSLNLARTVGDEPAHVEENARRFARALEVDPAQVMEVSQVHGRAVVQVSKGDLQTKVRTIEADALATDLEGRAVAVRTADCVPILLADLESGAVAAVHAGWRGVTARIVHAAFRRMQAWYGTRPEALRVALGPHIRAFEVGEDVAAHIEAAGLGVSNIDRSHPRPHADLARTLTAQLSALGVAEEHVDDVGGCTLGEPERFFSHRRDEGHTGRHLAAIVARR